MSEIIHIVCKQPTEATAWRSIYFPPLDNETYQREIVSYGIEIVPGWNWLHGDERSITLPGSPLNRALSGMVKLDEDGLPLYQTAALIHWLPDGCKEAFKPLVDNYLLASTERGVRVAHSWVDFTFWSHYSRLEVLKLIERVGDEPDAKHHLKRDKQVAYRLTYEGWRIARLCQKVYGWRVEP